MPASPISGGAPAHILALNDDPSVLGLYRDLLEEEGYRVTTRSYVDHDLADIWQLAPDLIVLDYMWAEDDDAWSLLWLLCLDPQTAGLPLVLCTGAVREARRFAHQLEGLGVRVVLQPFDIGRLLAVITAALATGEDGPARDG